MKTAEQQARALLASMSCVLMDSDDPDYEPSWREPKDMSSGELVELANLIREHDLALQTLYALIGTDGCERSTGGIGSCCQYPEKWCAPCRAWEVINKIGRWRRGKP